VCFYTSAGTHLIVDVNGYFPSGADYVSLVPGRLFDSRAGAATDDSQFAGGGMLSAESLTSLPVSGRGGVSASASAVALNVTVAEAQGSGFVTVWPCGHPMPNASNLNYGPGSTIPNAVITQVGENGSVCFYTSEASHLLVDIDGYFPAAT
jgi:hypothetical protein